MISVKKKQGFTIVELLIVIVVIAILATITVVAYLGVTNSTRNVQTVTTTSSWVKLINMYKSQNGTYPKLATANEYDNVCIGDTLIATPDFPQGACYMVDATVQAGPQAGATVPTVSTSQFKDLLQSTGAKLNDQPSTPIIVSAGSSTIKVRGMLYIGSSSNAQLSYYLIGDVRCPQGTKISGGSVTNCQIEFN